MKWLVSGLFTILVLNVNAQPANACGIKLTIKSAPPRHAAAHKPNTAKPVRGAEERPVVAARAKRKPIAAGPERTTSHDLIAAKQPTPPTPPPSDVATDTTPPVTTEPAVAAAEPTPHPAPVPAPAPAPAPKHVTTVHHKAPETAPAPAPAAAKPLTADTVLAEVHFGLGRDKIGAHWALNKAIRKLNADADARVRVEGYADPTGTPEGNMELSQRRAEWVRDYLVDKGIDTDRIDVKAFGDTVLKYGRTDGRNRRVSIVVE
jgi:outer membrane protein OmpA-like peptidoglycan-associated protein